LRGEKFVPANERLEIIASRPHGDGDAVLRTMRRLDFSSLLSSRTCREVDWYMVVARIVGYTRTLAEGSMQPWTACSVARGTG